MGLQETLLGTPGQTQVHQTGATRPPGYGFAQDVYRTLEQLMNSGTPFPTYQGNIDPGLSPMLQNSLRMAQGYSQSSPGEALSGINGVLGRFMNPAYSNPGGGSSMPFSGQFRPNAPTYNGGRVGGYDPQMSNQTGGGLMGGGGGPGLGTDPSKPGYNPGLDYMTPMGRGGPGRPMPHPGAPGATPMMPPGMGGGNMGGGAPQYGPPKQPGQGGFRGGGGPWQPPGGQQGGTPPWAPQSQGGPPIGPQSPWGNKVGHGTPGEQVNASVDTFDPRNPMPQMPDTYHTYPANLMPRPGGGMSYGNDGRAQQIPQRGPSIDPMGGGMPYGNDMAPRQMPGGGWGSITPGGGGMDLATGPMPMPGGGASWRPGVDPMSPGRPMYGIDPQQVPYSGQPGRGQGQPPTLSFPGGPSIGNLNSIYPGQGGQGGGESIGYTDNRPGWGGPGGQQMGPMQPPQQGGQPSVDFNNYLRSFLGQGQGGG